MTKLAKDVESLFSMVRTNEGKIKSIESTVANTAEKVNGIENEYPLLPPEADDLAKAVQRKGVEAMGGKKSNAYANKDLRRKVYRDIYTEIKRNYGLIDEMGRQKSYKKLKRKYLKGAFDIIDNYETPILLANEIDEENDLGDVT